MKTIYIIPMAGLCNRMRSIASGIFVAKKLGVDAVVYWNKEKGCNCKFKDLFLPETVKKVKFIDGGGIINVIPCRRNLKIPLLLQKLRYSQVIYDFKSKYGDIFSILKDVDDILLESPHSMGEHYPFNEIFKPVDAVRKKIDSCIKDFEGENIIGLHIRGTDNVKAKNVSTIDMFILRIDEEVEKAPNVKFFLATDEITVRESLLKRYGKRIIYNENVLSRDSVDGMQDAVVDLYCLSKTSRIIGSYWSSYSEIAAEIGGIKLEVCK